MNQQCQSGELEYALTKQEKYKELIKELSSLNCKATAGEHHRLYNACIVWSRELDGYQVTEIGRLLKEKLGVKLSLFYRDLDKFEKEIPEGNAKSKEKPRNGKEPLTAYFPGLVDIIEVDGKPAFFWANDGKIGWHETTEIEGQTHLPPLLEHLPWLLPRGTEVLKYYKEIEGEGIPWVHTLCEDIYSFLYNTSEMPSDDYYQELLIPWLLHTYLLEHFDYSPILCLYAVPERGKSRTGKAISFLSYRGAIVESLRESNIIRLATDCKATIFFDVMGLWRKAERNQSEDIILGRFEKGYIVPRVLYPERGAFKDTKMYNVFGATILATNESIHNILETRAITINMPEASRRFTGNVTPELALPLKEKLTALRAYYLDKPLPDAPKPATGRLGDILQPLYQVVKLIRGDNDSTFLNFVAKLEIERRMDRADTLEAQVVRAIAALEGETEHGLLPVRSVTDAINATQPENRQFSPQRVGRILDSLGLEKGYIHGGYRAIVWNKEKIIQLEDRYGVKTSSPSSPLGTEKTSENGELGELGEVSSGGGDPENTHIFSKETPPQPKYPGEVCVKCGGEATRKTMGYSKDDVSKMRLNYYCAECDAV